MKIDAYTENKFVAIKEYGIHEVLTRCLVWDNECRADEFEIIVLFNDDKVMSQRVFGHRTLEMCLESVLRELQENGVELIQIS